MTVTGWIAFDEEPPSPRAVAEFDMCEGDVEVTDTAVVGEYVFPRVETVDRDTFAAHEISTRIRFTAQFK